MLSVLQSFCLVWASTIRCLLYSLTKLLSHSSHSGWTYGNSVFLQWIWLLLISSCFCICWSMKAFASSDSFLGLPECSKFATEPVIRSSLLIWVTLVRLALKPSFFKDLNIATGGDLVCQGPPFKFLYNLKLLEWFLIHYWSAWRRMNAKSVVCTWYMKSCYGCYNNKQAQGLGLRCRTLCVISQCICH